MWRRQTIATKKTSQMFFKSKSDKSDSLNDQTALKSNLKDSSKHGGPNKHVTIMEEGAGVQSKMPESSANASKSNQIDDKNNMKNEKMINSEPANGNISTLGGKLDPKPVNKKKDDQDISVKNLSKDYKVDKKEKKDIESAERVETLQRPNAKSLHEPQTEKEKVDMDKLKANEITGVSKTRSNTAKKEHKKSETISSVNQSNKSSKSASSVPPKKTVTVDGHGKAGGGHKRNTSSIANAILPIIRTNNFDRPKSSKISYQSRATSSSRDPKITKPIKNQTLSTLHKRANSEPVEKNKVVKKSSKVANQSNAKSSAQDRKRTICKL
jgi:hypothetical protein